MTTQMPAGRYEFICNQCGETLSTNLGEFFAAWNFARSHGWRAQQNRTVGGFTHLCPCCNRGEEL